MGSKFVLLIVLVIVGLLIVPAYAITANELFDMMIKEMIRFGAPADIIEQNIAQKELVTSGFTHVEERPGTRENPTGESPPAPAPTTPQQPAQPSAPASAPPSSGGAPACVPTVAVSCNPACTAVTCGQSTLCTDNCGNTNKPGKCDPCPTFQCTPTITSCDSQCTPATCGKIIGCQDNCGHTISSACPACPIQGCIINGQPVPSGGSLPYCTGGYLGCKQGWAQQETDTCNNGVTIRGTPTCTSACAPPVCVF